MIILSAPSGTGKTTLRRELLKRDSRVRYSVSATTRPKRSEEQDGADYLFISEAEFDELIDKDGLLEWEEVYGHRYGTPRARVEELLERGHDVVMDLDIKGALHVKRLYPTCVTIFLLPPSLEELRRRLETRGQDAKEVVQARLDQAASEMKRAVEFNYVVENDTLDHTVHILSAIVEAERARSERIEEFEITEDR